MAWYHQYQFAEVTDLGYPGLKGFALPIVRYEIREPLHILAVEVQIKDGQTVWFKVAQIRLYKGSKDLINTPEQKSSAGAWKRFLKKMNLKGR